LQEESLEVWRQLIDLNLNAVCCGADLTDRANSPAFSKNAPKLHNRQCDSGLALVFRKGDQ
jgi:hypothetical protein